MSSTGYSEQYRVSSTRYSEQYRVPYKEASGTDGQGSGQPGLQCILETLAWLFSDYEALLSSLVGGEVDQLPRGLYHTAMRRHGLSSNQDKAIGSIPAFISQQYNKTKQPGLRPSLAGNVSPRVWQVTSPCLAGNVPMSGR